MVQADGLGLLFGAYCFSCAYVEHCGLEGKSHQHIISPFPARLRVTNPWQLCLFLLLPLLLIWLVAGSW
jgi:hypothetical protein